MDGPLNSIEELLAALEMTQLADIEDLLADVFDDPDGSYEVQPDGTLTVISHSRLGVDIRFPTTLDHFWDSVRDNDADYEDLYGEKDPEPADLIVVHIAKQLAAGKDIATASAGDWLVAPRSAEHLRYLVGVSRSSLVQGVFEIIGFEVIHRPGEKDRIRFAVRPCNRRVRVMLPTMHRPFQYLHSADVLDHEEVPDTGGASQAPAPAAAPPDWLAASLGEDDIIGGPDGVGAVRRLARDARPASSTAGAAAEREDAAPADPHHLTACFACVDPHDINLVLSFHATSPGEPGMDGACWWSFVDEWQRDDNMDHVDRVGVLRWVPLTKKDMVLIQLRQRNERWRTEVTTEALRTRLARALRTESGDSVDLARGYVQWAGYPGGLHLEVGDGQDYDTPLDQHLWHELRFIGWNAPGGENRNAWFESEGPGAVTTGLDLVQRTLALLRRTRSEPAVGGQTDGSFESVKDPGTADPQTAEVVSPPDPTMAGMNTSPTARTAAPQPRVIQFPHPGFEYSSSRRAKLSAVPGASKRDLSGVMGWNQDTHNRKYLAARGSIMASPSDAIETAVALGFWGEWEAPSRWERIDADIEAYHPSAVHTPLRPTQPATGPHQNTDPLVFGGAFRYTNCKMYRKAMKDMPPGSIVLFGRGMNTHGVPRFVLDTCFVVEEWEQKLEINSGEEVAYGQDLLMDVVLTPLLSERSDGHASIHPYRGRVPTPGSDQPFSFFPAVRHEHRPRGFARPILHPRGPLEGLLTETLKQGLKPSTVSGPAQVQEVWHEVVEQVLAQGCELGVQADTPQPGSLESALEAL